MGRGHEGLTFLKNDRKMQDCFRQHPDIYGSELDEAEDEDNNTTAPIDDAAASPAPASPLGGPIEGSVPAAATSAAPESHPLPSSSSPDPPASSDTERARAAKKQVERDHGGAADESGGMVPKAAHDARAATAIAGK